MSSTSLNDHNLNQLDTVKREAKTVFGKLCYNLLYYILHLILIKIDGSYRDISNGSIKSINFNLNLDDDIFTYHRIASCICSECRSNPQPNGICRCTRCIQPGKKSFYKHRIHELIYGEKPTFKFGGKYVTNYKIRNNSPDFWLKHWSYAFSPFRVAQSILHKLNMYLVDYTVYGNVLNAYVLFQLPYIPKSINFWHKHHLIPGISKKDFNYKFYGKIRYIDLDMYNYDLAKFCSGIMHQH